MMRIDIATVREQIAELDSFGKTAGGGTTRPSYSKAWRQGQDYVRTLMTAAGMTVECDAIGNLIGTYPGTRSDLPYVMAGSHLDTVPEGGSLDGALGVIAAIACVHSWHAVGYRPSRTVKVVAFVEEEGSVFGVGCLGSRFMAGEMTMDKLSALHDKQGRLLADNLADNGMDVAALAGGGINRQEIYAFLELHVEQGYELDLAGEPCAIVTDIVGIDRHWITVRGHANHAGTTRMDRRQDALVAASCLVQEIYEAAHASGGAYVATIGKLQVLPGATNVIPGQVDFTIETRAAHNSIMESVHHDIIARLQHSEARYGVTAAVESRHFSPAVSLGDAMVAEFADAASELGLAVNKMPSWAGHDAKIMANITSCGMLFVPSVNGISHSPVEDTRWDDVAVGLQLFNHTLRRVASKES